MRLLRSLCRKAPEEDVRLGGGNVEIKGQALRLSNTTNGAKPPRNQSGPIAPESSLGLATENDWAYNAME
ncbi:hypothetical protein [Salinibacter sp. 10B]|uniref:hypothetical protein n=1 Tax=Salinibacter sp. 10B TaxID=1923971 RepID=UPI0011B0E041|nr:hypothetical protein [Salinibacter sp. 10B]